MGFENDRKWIIEKKNDVAIKAMDNKERTDQFIEKRDEVEETFYLTLYVGKQ